MTEPTAKPIHADRAALPRRGRRRLALLLLLTAVGLAAYGVRPWFRLVKSDEPLIRVMVGHKVGLITSDGFMVVPLRYTEIGGFDDHGMARVLQRVGPSDPKVGWIDRRGREVIPTEYDFDRDDLHRFDASGRWIARRNGKFGVVDREGRTVIPFEWDMIDDFDSADMARVWRDRRFGWIDRSGKLVIPLEWSDAEAFLASGVARVQRGDLVGWIDRTGRVVIEPCEAEWRSSLAGNWIGSAWGTVAGYAVKDGQVKRLEVSEVEVGDRSENGLRRARRHGRWGWIRRDGSVAIAFTWDKAEPFVGGQAIVTLGRKYGVIDERGEVIVPLEHDLITRTDPRRKRSFFDDDGDGTDRDWPVDPHLKDESPDGFLARFLRLGRWGLLDRRGRIAVPAEWEEVRAMDTEGFASVMRDSRWGWVNRKGELVIKPEWLGATPFEGDRAAVRGPKGWGVIDRRGAIIVPPEYDGVEFLHESRVIVVNRSVDSNSPQGQADSGLGYALGLRDWSGAILTAIEFDEIAKTTSPDRFLARRGRRMGVIDRAGAVVIPFGFEEIRVFNNADWLKPMVPEGYVGDEDGAKADRRFPPIFVAEEAGGRSWRFRADGTPLDRVGWDAVRPTWELIGGWHLQRSGNDWPPAVKPWLRWLGVADHPLVRGDYTEVRDPDNRLLWSSSREAWRSLALPAAALLVPLAGWLVWPGRTALARLPKRPA